MANALCQKLLLLGQFGFLPVEIGFQPFGLGFLLSQGGTCTGEKLLLFAAVADEGLFTRLHGAGFRGSIAANTFEQLIRTERFCRMSRKGQQRD